MSVCPGEVAHFIVVGDQRSGDRAPSASPGAEEASMLATGKSGSVGLVEPRMKGQSRASMVEMEVVVRWIV